MKSLVIHIIFHGMRLLIREKSENPECLFFGIFIKENDEDVGNLKLEPIKFDQKSATFEILIGDQKSWGKGIATEATKLIVDWVFDVLELNEINLGVISENKGAVQVYEKVGFTIDCIKKNLLKHSNVFYIANTMSIKK